MKLLLQTALAFLVITASGSAFAQSRAVVEEAPARNARMVEPVEGSGEAPVEAMPAPAPTTVDTAEVQQQPEVQGVPTSGEQGDNNSGDGGDPRYGSGGNKMRCAGRR